MSVVQYPQSVLGAAGPVAARIERFWWIAFTLAAVVYVATIGALLFAIARSRRAAGDQLVLDEGREQRMGRVVGFATAVTVGILMVFFLYDLSLGRAQTPAPSHQPLTVEVTGHEWWWEATYADTSPHGRFATANEIHVPVGQPVVFILTSHDVIHSIWTPSLAGKKDLIPGYTQSFWFQADTAGSYRGQCAEFCGAQHAKMALFIVAEPLEKYRAWVEAQRRPAATPTDSVARRGMDVFTGRSCVMCHSIEGTSAGSHAGPDLTHLASRGTIAAGSLTNSRESLAGWILDPQQIKPGTKMPATALVPQDLEALVTYLQTLK